MKKILILATAMLLLGVLAYADTLPPGIIKPTVEIPQGKAFAPTREVPPYVFTRNPYSIIVNYYDYMIGSYSGLPLRVIPDVAGGGYFMTYMGRRQPTGTRRVFYTYMDASGNVINNNEITSVQNHEGFPTLVVDPVSGKPMYAWHCNADADPEFEVQFTSDAFMFGIAGLFNDIQLIADGPITIVSPEGITTTNNEFIWPTATIGPSPVAGKRRVYVAMRNYVSHAVNNSPSENAYIAYADFDQDDIEVTGALQWNHITIPEQNSWNVNGTELRRPYQTITADNAGNLIYAGYHIALDAESNDIVEADMDVFICPNYGEGTWVRYSEFSNLPAWNPPASPGGTSGYFTNANDIPYGPGEMYWGIVNSGHVNTVVDNEGKVHFPALWGLLTVEGTYYPAMQFVKEFVYDIPSNTFEFREIYPQKDPADDYNVVFMPWDMEAPWGAVDAYGGDAASGYFPLIATAWPFPHWDASAHSDAMMFHYNAIKITEPNSMNMMACVWQDSQRARWFNYFSDTEYSAFANTPEIYISVSPDNGNTWSEPIVLNNVETPQMAGIKPMYVYPADKVIYMGTDNDNRKIGKLGIMFYNDYTWGSNVNAPAYHPTPDGGEVMFMELQITFPYVVSVNDQVTPPAPRLLQQNYPNPFNPSTTIRFDLPKAGKTDLAIYNVKGQMVSRLVNSELGNGAHTVVWDGKDSNGNSVPSGIYFYRLNFGTHTETRKMMLMK